MRKLIFIIKGHITGSVYQEGDKFVTEGCIGQNNYYESIVDVLIDLQGHGINLDDIYFE